MFNRHSPALDRTTASCWMFIGNAVLVACVNKWRDFLGRDLCACMYFCMEGGVQQTSSHFVLTCIPLWFRLIQGLKLQEQFDDVKNDGAGKNTTNVDQEGSGKSFLDLGTICPEAAPEVRLKVLEECQKYASPFTPNARREQCTCWSWIEMKSPRSPDLEQGVGALSLLARATSFKANGMALYGSLVLQPQILNIYRSVAQSSQYCGVWLWLWHHWLWDDEPLGIRWYASTWQRRASLALMVCATCKHISCQSSNGTLAPIERLVLCTARGTCCALADPRAHQEALISLQRYC